MGPMHSEAKQTEPLECGADKGLLQGSSKEYGWLMLKRPKHPDKFQGRVFKGKVRERVAGCVCDHLVHSALVGWWWGNRVVSQGLTSILRLHPVWRLCIHGHHAVNFYHLVGVLVSAKQLRNVYQTLLYMSFREELKILWLCYMADLLFKLLPVLLAQLLFFVTTFLHFFCH